MHIRLLSYAIIFTILFSYSSSYNTTITLNSGYEQYDTRRLIISLNTAPDEEILNELESFGDIGGVLGDIVTLDAREEVFEKIKSLPYVDEAKPSKRIRALLKASTEDIGSAWMNELKTLNVDGVDGSGVIIGIVDTGIDYTHPDLQFPDGRPKVLYIWDQTLEGKPPEGFDYGYECSTEEIIDATCPQRDLHGHGTMVAAIAASSGLAPGGYRGVAPGAEIIFVKSGGPACEGASWFFDEKEILDGIYYIFQKAQQLGKRVVINLSLGTDIGGHDGSSFLERALDALAMQGAIIVAAAGNSAQDDRHAMGDLKTSPEATLEWVIPELTREYALSIWFSNQDEVRLTLTSADGVEINIENGTKVNTGVGVIEAERNEYADSYEWLISVKLDERVFLSQTLWKLSISGLKIGNGVWHAWIESDTCNFVYESFLDGSGYVLSEEYTVSIPATARYVIAVGAYVTRNAWLDASGEEVSIGSEVGSIAGFSGRGPTRDGRTKPDITAPGSVIIAAKPLNIEQEAIDPDEFHTVSQGTSMAAPHVAGVAAMILQLSPTLNASEVRRIIIDAARQDEFTGEIDKQRGSNTWGWGKLSAKIGYLVDIALVGGQRNLNVSLVLDGEKIGVVQPGEDARLFIFGKGERSLEVKPLVNSPRIRVAPEPSRNIINEDGRVTFKLQAEYLIRIYEYGGTLLDEIWVREGDVIDLNEIVAKAVEPGGLLVRKSVGAIIDSQGRLVQGSKITVTGPEDYAVIILDDYTNLMVLLIVVSASVISAVFLRVYLAQRRHALRLKSTFYTT